MTEPAMPEQPQQTVVTITHLRDSLGVAYQHVATTHEPIIVQRYSRKDVVLVPLWEWEFFKQLEADIRAGRCPVGREKGEPCPCSLSK
jgi:hypothetical protein